jgi:hypothetical protein
MTRETRRDILVKWLVFFGALTAMMVGAMLYEYWIVEPQVQSL